MKIIASSTAPAEKFFLHAGYISSMPRSYEFRGIDRAESPDQAIFLSVSKSLQLEGNAQSTAGAVTVTPSPAETTSAYSDVTVMAWGVTLFFCFAGFLRYVYRHTERIATILLLTTAVFCLLGLYVYNTWQRHSTIISYAAHPGGPNTMRYKDPHTATHVIMHGLLADGIINTEGQVTSFNEIHKEVAFPTTQLTPGMKYALDNYAFDGWGRPFIFTAQGRGAFRITSPGPDGVRDTDDDISITVRQPNDEYWDQWRWGFFVQREENNLRIFFHRWPGGLFIYRNEVLARQKSGSTIFDVWASDSAHLDELNSVRQSELWKPFDAMKEGELFLWIPSWRNAKI